MKIKLNLRRLRKSNLIIFNGTFKTNLSWRILFSQKINSTVFGLFEMFALFTGRTVRTKISCLHCSLLGGYQDYWSSTWQRCDRANSEQTVSKQFISHTIGQNMMIKTFILTNSKWRTFFVTTKILSQRFLSFVHRPTKIIDAWFRKRRSCYLTRFSNCNPSVYETDCSL